MEETKFIIVTSFAVISIICCLFGFIEQANDLIFIGLAISPKWIILSVINTSNIYAKQNYADFLKSKKIKKLNPDVQ